MLDSIFTSSTTGSIISMSNIILALITSICLGFVISLVYIKSNKDRNKAQSFILTLIMLPGVVSIIIMLVGTNIASAFSLSGAFAIIRFRSAPGNSKDITYVLFAMAVGLASGMGFMIYAIIVAAILCGVMYLLEFIKFGRPKATSKLLKITIPENLDYENAFDTIMNRYTTNYNLLKVKTTDLGSLFELEYEVDTKNNIREKDFIDEIRCRNGNLNITLVLNSKVEEF